MAGDTGMAGKVALLLWAQTLGLAGAQSIPLLVEPPWLPAVLWDRVTLTCRGSGTDRDTPWYKDGRLWWRKGPDSLTVTDSGTYSCERPGTGFSPRVTVSKDSLVLQVPARALLEGDTVTLRCRGWWNNSVTSVSFYHDGKKLVSPPGRSQLSLPPLQLQHSGHFSCEGRVGLSQLYRSAPVPVRVQELFSVPLLEGPPELPEGSPLNLSCLSTPSPLRPRAPLLYRFYRDGQSVGGPQGSPQLLVPAVGVSHSGNYSCEVRSEGGAVRKSSARLGVTVRSGLSPCHLHLAARRARGGPGSPPGAWGRRCGTFGHLPVRGHQPAGTGRAPRVPGTQPRAGPGGDTTGNHWTPLEHSGRRPWRVPPLPAPARGWSCGLAPVEQLGCQEAAGKGPPGAPGPPRGGGGAVHPRREHQADGGVPPCQHTPGSPGDLRRAASNPWATAGMRGHLRECAVTLGALGALGVPS